MNCKVIATSFQPKRIVRRPNSAVLRFPDHYQDITTQHDALNQIQGIIAFELGQNPGEKLDIIIVNSDCGFREGNEYLDAIDGIQTKYGKIRVLHKPNNNGWSFGAYNYAYEKFKKEYEYWMFTEDDILIGGDKYYFEAMEKLNSSEDIAFVAMVKVCDHSGGQHAGGGIGLTTRKYLDMVVQEHGYLPHFRGVNDESLEVRHWRAEVIQHGEIPFTNIFTKLGYVIAPFGNQEEWSLVKNRIIPYYDYKNGKQYYLTT
jgi:hypothetical protein